MSSIDASQEEKRCIPVMQEALVVEKEQVETGTVRVRKVIHEVEQAVDMTLQSQTVHVERRPMNQFVDVKSEPHQEGDTLVVPVYEEVVIKQLVLREEVRFTVCTAEQAFQERVTLLREEAVVERRDSSQEEWAPEGSNPAEP